MKVLTYVSIVFAIISIAAVIFDVGTPTLPLVALAAAVIAGGADRLIPRRSSGSGRDSD